MRKDYICSRCGCDGHCEKKITEPWFESNYPPHEARERGTWCAISKDFNNLCPCCVLVRKEEILQRKRRSK